MDPWNRGQRMMTAQQLAGQNPGSRNVSFPQSFYRPPIAQQFYPNQSSIQALHGYQPGHQPGHQPGQIYPRNINPMPQHFLPTAAQSQPSRQMTPAEIDDIRKRKKFEEQQRRLLALKQKGGQPRKIPVDNPLNDLFGRKGSPTASSLLGSFGDTPAPKAPNPGFSGSVNPGQGKPGFSGANTGPGLSNWNLQGSSVPTQTSGVPSSGNFEQLQGSSKAVVPDEFGDFQQSPANQAFAGVFNVEHSIPPNSVPAGHATKNTQPQTGVVEPCTASTADKEQNVSQAVGSPSIEELMKKSLMLDKEPQSPGKKFQKPKLPKMVKSQPSHFTESTKASKWENLESLSEIFTVPQPVMVQPEPGFGNQSHMTGVSGDDWSDFSGAEQSSGGIFQGPGTQGSMQSSLELSQTKSEHGLSNYGEGIQNVNQGLPVPGGLLNSGMQTVLPVAGAPWGISTPKWHEASVVPTKQSAHESQGMIEGTAMSMKTEEIPQGGIHPEHQDLEEPSVDPEQQIYGVQLPSWSKESTSLPAVYKQIHQMCYSGGDYISTSQLYPILLSSDLSRDKLGHIWSQCNKAVLGQLSEQELYLILGMVALAQAGLQINKLTLEKLASCTTAPIPSFPERIFQNDAMSSVPPQQATGVDDQTVLVDKSNYSSESISISDTSVDTGILSKPPSTVINAVKQPDWSKWKTSKAGHVDDQFKDFQALMPKDSSTIFQGLGASSTPNLTLNTTPVMSDISESFGKFQTSAVSTQGSITDVRESPNSLSDVSIPTRSSSDRSFMTSSLEKPALGEDFSVFHQTPGNSHNIGNNQSLLPEFQSFSSGSTKTDTPHDFGLFASASTSVAESQGSFLDNRSSQTSSHLMSVPLQASQRYTLNGEDESIDHHEKAWLKCLTSCFATITKSCQILQTISDPQLLNEIFSSQQGISHFSAIIEIYCVSQRVKASVLKSAPNNKKLKEALQNIDNVWKTCLAFEPFKSLLPAQSFNFTGCHVDENGDLNLTCGVCLLNVDKSWVSSLVNKGRSGKLSYGSRYYHTTCANFWCNKVDSVLPTLQLNVGNSLI